MTQIGPFKDEYRFLSNFYQATVEFEGIWYPTAEHAYVAAKSLDQSFRINISTSGRSAGQVKRLGRTVVIRPDWRQVRLQVMYDIVRFKFANNSLLLQRLKDTGGAELVEFNTWGDTFWGVCRGQGENNLGKILMRVRAEL